MDGRRMNRELWRSDAEECDDTVQVPGQLR